MKSIWIVLVLIMLNVVFSQFRISSHHLEIELTIYRYNNIGKNERNCKICNSNMRIVVESEYHFLLCGPIYNDLRRKYNVRCNWPNLTRFKNLLSSQNVQFINNVANFIFEGMNIREKTLKTIAFQCVSYIFICIQ